MQTVAPEKRLRNECCRWRKLAIAATSFAAVTVFAAIVTPPLIYAYFQAAHSQVWNEVSYCRIKTRSLWKEVLAMKNAIADTRANRTKRAWLFGKWVPDGVGYAGVQTASYGVATERDVPSAAAAAAVNPEPISQCKVGTWIRLKLFF